MTIPATKPAGKRFFHWGLRNKVLIPAILITALTGGLLTLQSTVKMREMVYQDQASQGMILCYFVVFDVDQYVLNAKADAAREFLQDYQQEHGAAYLYVLDGNNRVLAQTFDDGLPGALQKLVDGQKSVSGIQKQEVLLDGRHVLDISVPFVGAAGHVHLGMDLTPAQRQVSQITLRAIGIVLALLAAGISLLWVILNRTLKPVKALTQAARKIATEGDLTTEIPIETHDEVGQMASYFNEMLEAQKNMVKEQSATLQTLNETVQGLEALSYAQNQSITVQAAALQQTQVTAQEIKQTSQMAAQKAGEVLQKAEKAGETGRLGQDSMERSLQGLTDIRQQVSEIAEKVLDLTDRTRQIGTITDTVKDLADQSNILALNAAIEAVRSGEHGKGFGLVAREIRRLADQSLQATGRVKEILDNIRDAIDKVVTITDSGSRRMEGGLELVKNSGENLRSLAGVLKDNSASVKQIAAAVEQQNTGISQIFGAVTDQTRMMAESVKQVGTTARMVKVLQETFDRLSASVVKFKV